MSSRQRTGGTEDARRKPRPGPGDDERRGRGESVLGGKRRLWSRSRADWAWVGEVGEGGLALAGDVADMSVMWKRRPTGLGGLVLGSGSSSEFEWEKA